MSSILRFWSVVMLAGILLAVGFSCKENPTKPHEAKGLRLYVVDRNRTTLYAIDPDVDSVLDSLPDMYATNMLISNDGLWIFIIGQPPPDLTIGFYKICTDPLGVFGMREDKGGRLAFVNNKTTLLRAKTGILEYIDPTTFQVMGVDSITLRHLASADTVSFVIGVTDNNVNCYDFNQKKILSAKELRLPGRRAGVINHLSLHPSGREGYAIMHDTPELGWFVVFDTPSLEIKFNYRLYSYKGEVLPSANGRLVLVSDPGSLPAPPTTVGHLLVYDSRTAEIVKVIPTDTLSLLDPLRRPAAVSQMAYSPDGSNAFISTGSHSSSVGPVLVFDMEKLEFTHRIDMPHEAVMISDIVVGQVP